MTSEQKEMWQINIENAVSAVCANCSPEAADAIFERYDATDFENLSPCFYADVFGALEQLAYND